MSLQEQLEAKHQEILVMAPDAAKSFDEDTQRFIKNGLTPVGLEVGDQMPSFELPDQTGQLVKSADLLKNGPLVVSFYRGGWCPYCNLQLQALQKLVPEFEKLGAQLVAISPQKPDESLSTAEKNELSFTVLSDADRQVGESFQLMFKVSEDIKPLYQGFGIDLDAVNGDDSWRLPVPATFVVNNEGEVVYAFVNGDYKKRAEPNDILQVLRSI